MRSFVRFYLPAYLYAVAIFIVSSIPRLNTPSLGLEMQDKLYHLGEYVVFGLLLLRAFSVSSWGHFPWPALVAGGLWAAFDEVHQHFVPGRDASLFDMVADWLGLLLALALYRWRSRRGGQAPVFRRRPFGEV